MAEGRRCRSPKRETEWHDVRENAETKARHAQHEQRQAQKEGTSVDAAADRPQQGGSRA